MSTGANTEYAGNYVYENSSLNFFNQAEGYVEPNGSDWDYVYQYKDLPIAIGIGNIRLSYSDGNEDGSITTSEIREENNYYPFGLRHKGYNNVINGTHHSYTYNGKEEQEELSLNWLDYDARNYDASLGRFMNIDPLADKYHQFTPYHYTSNNPVLFVDNDGRDFGLTFDFENGTVTISATYYASQNDTEAAQNAADYWNNQNGNFSYEYTDEDGNTQTLSANFSLTVETVEIEEGANKQRSLLAAANGGPAGESNIFSVVDNGNLTKPDGTERNGVTTGGVNVKIETDRLGTETGGHEVGHTLGITHSVSGIMTAAQTDPNRSDAVTRSNVSSIVYYPIKSTPENPTGARDARSGRGQATLHFQNATEVNSPQTSRGFRRFRNGRVITNE